MSTGWTFDILSEYARNARLKPALLASLPVAFFVLGYGLKSSVLLGALFGPLSVVGFTYLLALVTRDFGLAKQTQLFRAWGGKPTVAKLRHRDTSLNTHTGARYRARAAKALGTPMPTAAEEQADPGAADSLYEAYSNLLIERTRDTKRFRLLFEELIDYGFRRNLLSIRPLGFPLSVLCSLVEIGLCMRSFYLTGRIEVDAAVFAVLDLFLVACWWQIVSPEWVRRAAEAYAERLLAASENLPAESQIGWGSEGESVTGQKSKRFGQRAKRVRPKTEDVGASE